MARADLSTTLVLFQNVFSYLSQVFKTCLYLVLQALAAWCVLMWKFFIVHPSVSLLGVCPRSVKTCSLIRHKDSALQGNSYLTPRYGNSLLSPPDIQKILPFNSRHQFKYDCFSCQDKASLKLDRESICPIAFHG